MRSRLALLLVSLLLALVLGELALRAVGFRFSLAPEEVEFGWPDPEVRRDLYFDDPDLFWVPLDYARRLALLEQGPVDIAFLGDSCTEFGSYPEALLTRLSAMREGEVSGVVLGVAGWSTWQGRRQLERDVAPHAPRVVTLYFGWNDHWLGFGVDDRTIGESNDAFPSWLRGLRLTGALQRALLVWRGRDLEAQPPRVAPEDFAANLRAMIETARDAGSVPVVLTAPTSHRRGAEPPYLRSRWIDDLSRLVPLHERYADLARQVAREERAPLCDLHRAFAALPPEVRTASFQHDGIHLTHPGDERLARILAGCLRAHPATRAALRLRNGGASGRARGDAVRGIAGRS